VLCNFAYRQQPAQQSIDVSLHGDRKASWKVIDIELASLSSIVNLKRVKELAARPGSRLGYRHFDEGSAMGIKASQRAPRSARPG
jgi:hypothetical protein